MTTESAENPDPELLVDILSSDGVKTHEPQPLDSAGATSSAGDGLEKRSVASSCQDGSRVNSLLSFACTERGLADLLVALDELFPAHVRPQRFGDRHRAVLVLVVLEERHHHPGNREPGGVQRVQVLG